MATDSATIANPRASSRTATALKLVVVVAVILGGAYLLTPDLGRQDGGFTSINLAAAEGGPVPVVGQLAPDFTLTRLGGSRVSLSDYRGQPVWVNFWASWCPPCRAEAPDLQATYEEYKGSGLVLLAVNMAEDRATVQGYVERIGLTFPVLLDPSNQVAARYRITGLPSHFLIDREGMLKAIQVGGMSRDTMRTRLEQVLGLR